MEENPWRSFTTNKSLMVQEIHKPQIAVVWGKMTVFPFCYTTLIVRGCHRWDMGQEEYCYVLLLGFMSICLVGWVAICPWIFASPLPIHGAIISGTWPWTSFLWKSLCWVWLVHLWYGAYADMRGWRVATCRPSNSESPLCPYCLYFCAQFSNTLYFL